MLYVPESVGLDNEPRHHTGYPRHVAVAIFPASRSNVECAPKTKWINFSGSLPFLLFQAKIIRCLEWENGFGRKAYQQCVVTCNITKTTNPRTPFILNTDIKRLMGSRHRDCASKSVFSWEILTSLVSGTDGEFFAFRSGVGEFESKFRVFSSVVRLSACVSEKGTSFVLGVDNDNWDVVLRPDGGARSMSDGRGTRVGPIDPKSYGLFLPTRVSWGGAKLAAPSS